LTIIIVNDQLIGQRSVKTAA